MLKGLTRNKSVVILGPSRCVADNNREYIESHDLVVRVNFGWPVPAEMQPKVGERVDILYHFCGSRYILDNIMTEEFVRQVKLVGLSKINKFSHKMIKFCDDHSIPWMDNKHPHDKLQKELEGTSPNTGYFALNQLLETDLKKIYVTGFTFYREPYTIHNPETHFASSEKVKDRNCNTHNNDIQFGHFLGLLKSDNRIEIDEGLKRVIRMERIS